MKIAVTTASGNLGSAIINHLKQEIGAENAINKMFGLQLV